MGYFPLRDTLRTELIERIRALSSPIRPIPTGQSEHLTLLPDIQVVLFDVYGTLFVSGTGDISLARETSNARALTEALHAVGFRGDLDEAGAEGVRLLLKRIQRTHTELRKVGREFPEVDIVTEWYNVLSKLRKKGLLHDDLPAKGAEVLLNEAAMRVSVEYECRVNPVWPMPGAAATLTALQERGVLLGIVSNAQFYTPLLFSALFGKSQEKMGFSWKWCAWSFEMAEAKPSANLFHRVVTPLALDEGIRSNQILYVGNDRLNDIWPAAGIGLKTALFAGDRRSLRLREDDPRCADLHPDLVLTSLSQILTCV
jgi:putative hydrolase of the HAD superfamily